MKVKEYKLEKLAANYKIEESKENIIEHDSLKLVETNACRICFTNADTNPLLAPCKCTGSMKYVHLQCLKAWLNQSKISQLTTRVNSYRWKSFGCEICKTKYPCIPAINPNSSY